MRSGTSFVRSTSSLPTHRVVILGAGQATQGVMPTAMTQVDSQRRVLDWLLNAFSKLSGCEISFVRGYMADTFMEPYPDIRFLFNPVWDETGPAKSLSVAPLTASRATFVSYADIVFRPETVRRLSNTEAELVLAIDRQWRVRYAGRDSTELEIAEKIFDDNGQLLEIGKDLAQERATAEFVGLFKFSNAISHQVERILRGDKLVRSAGIPELIQLLIEEGVQVALVDIAGDWAELNDPQDLARFVLGTKAESLERLRPLVQRSEIGNLVCFTHSEWESSREAILLSIKATFEDALLIVRSSALSEDTWHATAAGIHESILNVPGSDQNVIIQAVDNVFASYSQSVPANQVFVQKMLCDVAMSGVVMTRTPTECGPYYVINYDNTSSRTDTVTGGTGSKIGTAYIHRHSKVRPEMPSELGLLMAALPELEQLIGHDSLDIEFALTADKVVHILQVRPITIRSDVELVDDAMIEAGLNSAARQFEQLQTSSPFLVGSRTQLSVMADWNPAEIIGVKPKRLAFSLYRHLITDEIWARQRAEYGYRDVRPCNLIVDMLGHPYVDVRATFNSFIPADLPSELAERLIHLYLDRLRSYPELHDKVEFDVLFTCMTFDFDERCERLREAGFDGADIELLRESLTRLTCGGIARASSKVDEKSLDTLNERCSVILTANISPLEKAFLLIEDTRTLGTLAFSHLARNAFIAVSLLRSLEAVGATTVKQTDAFLSSLRTVAGDMQHDAHKLALDEIEWREFADTYGHLRPGTYDITSSSYASAPEIYLKPMPRMLKMRSTDTKVVWDSKTRASIEQQLQTVDLGCQIDALETFMKRAIEMREYGKFQFTKNLSLALDYLAEFGDEHGVKKEELAHIAIEDLLAFRSSRAETVADELVSLARLGRQRFHLTQTVCLPRQIFSAEDLYCFEKSDSVPNFVTTNSVEAPVVVLVDNAPMGLELDGNIVLIPHADPGFDWIFTHGIAGLITMYGGSNSHMTVRSAEFGLPAAIGVGDKMFERLLSAMRLELNCAAQTIKIVC